MSPMRETERPPRFTILADLAWMLRMLWACRISIVSGGGGVFLFLWAVQARGLFADLSFSGPHSYPAVFWTGVFVTLVVSWAIPVHYGARRTLDEGSWMFSRTQRQALGDDLREVEAALKTRYKTLKRCIPRCLGAVPFLAVGLGIFFGTQTQTGVTGLAEGRATIVLGRWLLGADVAAFVAYVVWIVLRRLWLERTTLSDAWLAAFRWIATAVMAALFLATAYFMPVTFATFWPRALLVPVLFGALVLPLGEVQIAGHRSGFPLLALLIVSLVCGTALNASFHDLRTVARTGDDGRLAVSDAITRWRLANGCSAKAEDACAKRPLIVAIDGGASRAAFMAATFVGEILDRTPPADGEARTPGRRIFAMSGVSGGAFGAATFQAALADAQRDGAEGRPPCRTVDRSWFGDRYWSPDQTDFKWRECLQDLTAGDYLSVSITGLAFRDFAAPVPHLIEDRATLLEQAFERHYDYTTSAGNDGLPTIFKNGHVCEGPAERGLCRLAERPLDFFRSYEQGSRRGWIPLLLLNGTSVRTGRRILVSDVKPDEKQVLFPEAFDLGEMLSTRCPPPAPRIDVATYPGTALQAKADASESARTREYGVCGQGSPLDGPEVRLSTAALVSARFPFISPDGAFTMRGDPNNGDQVVDGGYFENSGLTSALDLSAALIRAHLHPIILSIGNDPDADKEGSAVAGRSSMGPLVPTADNGFVTRLFGVVRAPLDTLQATREGHAAEAQRRSIGKDFADLTLYRLRVAQTPELTAAHASAYDRDQCGRIWELHREERLSMASVSMSWWLSALVQADLDAQKCSAQNRDTMNELLTVLGFPQDVR